MCQTLVSDLTCFYFSSGTKGSVAEVNDCWKTNAENISKSKINENLNQNKRLYNTFQTYYQSNGLQIYRDIYTNQFGWFKLDLIGQNESPNSDENLVSSVIPNEHPAGETSSKKKRKQNKTTKNPKAKERRKPFKLGIEDEDGSEEFDDESVNDDGVIKVDRNEFFKVNSIYLVLIV